MSTFRTRGLPMAALAVLATSAMAAAPAMARTLYVKPRAKGSACTRTKPCGSIGAAVAKAHAGDTIDVARGTYHETVTLGRRLHLVGIGHPVINAKSYGNGVLISGPRAAGSSVTGFTVENALDEGILAMLTSHVTISRNLVKDNDQGIRLAKPAGECAAHGPVPGDCGEGLHLMSVSHSKVTGNTVRDNLGGILLTDELGPTHDNLISSNQAIDNAYDCGITIAGHSVAAMVGGKLQPGKGGVYKNLIVDNTANGNGLKGQGAGILIAAGAPGSAVYANTVQDNTADGNGLGGFTLHSHAPGQFLNGNRIIDNTFSHDGLAGGAGRGPGDVDFGITKSAAIIIASAVTKLSGTVVRGNHISRDYYGIWTRNVPKIKQTANRFAKSVTVDVFQS